MRIRKLGQAWLPAMGLVALALALAMGCGQAEPAGADTTAAPVADSQSEGGTVAATGAEPARPDVREHMNANFFLAIDARDALVDGDLEEARKRAKVLATQETAQFSEDFKPYLGQLKQQADAIVQAGSLVEAGTAVGMLAVACGNCHWHARKGPEAPREPALPFPDSPDDVGERMFRHEVGADQMWFGLMIPSEQDFRSGTVTLTRAPLPAPQTHGEPMDDREHAAMERIRAHAKAARAAESHAKRAAIYGELIAECATCHQVRPRPGP